MVKASKVINELFRYGIIWIRNLLSTIAQKKWSLARKGFRALLVINLDSSLMTHKWWLTIKSHRERCRNLSKFETKLLLFLIGYLGEILHIQVDTLTIKSIFWLMKIASDYLFLRQPFIVPNLARHLTLTKDDLRLIVQQNCQIREQIIHCFIKYYRRNKLMPSNQKEKLSSRINFRHRTFQSSYQPHAHFVALLDSFDGPFMQIYSDLTSLVKQRLADRNLQNWRIFIYTTVIDCLWFCTLAFQALLPRAAVPHHREK